MAMQVVGVPSTKDVCMQVTLNVVLAFVTVRFAVA
jgi:hypothetical protein